MYYYSKQKTHNKFTFMKYFMFTVYMSAVLAQLADFAFRNSGFLSEIFLMLEHFYLVALQTLIKLYIHLSL